MHHRKIQNTSVALTGLGFGACVIGNLYRVTDAHVASAALDAAWDAGIRYFDTAPHYGLGLSERRLGAALRDRPHRGTGQAQRRTAGPARPRRALGRIARAAADQA